MKVESQNFAHSLMYMVSWTTTIKRIQKILTGIIDNQTKTYTFVDVGCGKGKVVLLARKLEIIGCNSLDYVGIDFEPNLLAIARQNSIKMFKDEGNFIAGDALEIDYSNYSRNLIIFLYNPFDKPLIEKFLTKVSQHKPILVYVNPVNRDSIIDFGYQSLFKRDDWHPNLTFEIFAASQW